MATQTLVGFIGKVVHNKKSTPYGMRAVTTLSIGVRDKTCKQISWNYVNIWGTPEIKKGDIVRVGEVKSLGRTRYGKLLEHNARNKRDRKPKQAKETKPQQLSLF